MNRIKLITIGIALTIAPFIAVVALAGTPIRIEAVKNGLDVAVTRQIIPKEGVLEKEVKHFLKLLIDGSTPEEASTKTGVKLKVIERLQQLGASQTAELKPFEETETATTEVSEKNIPKPVAIAKSTKTKVRPTSPTVQSRVEASEKKESKLVAVAVSTEPTTLQPVAQDNPPKELPSGNSRVQADQIGRGLKAADRMGEIAKYSTTGLAIQKMLQRMRWGDSLAFASQQAGVDRETVIKLLALGGEKPVREDTNAIANALVRGLSKANAIGEIGYSSRVSYRVQNVVRRLRRGNSLNASTRYSGVSSKFINRLLELGNYRTNS
jgi:hypothetical protein